MNDFFISLWRLILEMSPYLLLGFGVAGLLYAFVPSVAYNKYLSQGGFRSVFNATLLGIPLPLCSCGVLPTTVSLRRNGASRGACTSFLISTPQTGIDSILATYSLLGLPFAIIRPLAALVTGILGGCATDVAFKNETTDTQSKGMNDANDNLGFMAKLKKAFCYAFGELLQDVGRWLVIGLIVAAAITVAVPDNFFSVLQQYPLLNMLLVLVVAIPMYICATGSIPIALSLMLKGMTPGAAFVLLMAGPAINVASMLVISKAFGRRQTIVYLSSIILGAISFGLIIDYLLPAHWFLVNAITHTDACHDSSMASGSIISIASSIIFVLLLTRAMIHRFSHHHECCCGENCHDEEKDKCHDEECKTYNCKNNKQILHLKVIGMRCSHCAANVKEALMSQAGVETVDIDLNSGLVTINGNHTELSDESALIRKIEEAGYSVEGHGTHQLSGLRLVHPDFMAKK